jgi:hypothetical protein
MSMTDSRPPRDSALDAVTLGFRVLSRPSYLWAPIVISVIAALPLLALPGYPERPGTFATQADLDAFFQAFIPVLILSTTVAVLLGPISTSVIYRLGSQFIHGQPPQPFPTGWIGLAWRFFLQALVVALLAVLGAFAAIILIALLQAIVGLPLALLIAGIGTFILFVGVAARLAIAPVLLLSGLGPIEAIQRSWHATRGHWGQVIRWLLVAGLIVSICATLVNVVVGLLLGSLGIGVVTTIVGPAVAAPFSMITAIVYIQLSSLLTGPGESMGPEVVAAVSPVPQPDPVNG